MKSGFWKHHWYVYLLLSVVFLYIANSGLVWPIEAANGVLIAKQSAGNQLILTSPEWAQPAGNTLLIIITAYLLLLLPRLNAVKANITGMMSICLLIGIQQILIIQAAVLIPILMPCLLIMSGHLIMMREKNRVTTDKSIGSEREIKDDNDHQDTMVYGAPKAGRVESIRVAESNTETTIGRYVIEKEIGRGAMGNVYLGKDLKINRTVAIKTLPLSQEFEKNELQDVKDRFFREAETAGKLTHSNIVTIYDVGEAQELAYIAMEFLNGHDLIRYTKPKRLLPIANVLQIIILAAEALNYAHKQNVIHRDIKPANIMLLPKSATIKLTDFGIARITDSNKTKTGIVLGTPSYMSPEQLRGEKKLDGRSDLFSLGVMFYQLLCGELPFRGESIAALMFKITSETHRDITQIRPELRNKFPCPLPILDKILEKRPENRYQTGEEFALDLRSCLKKIRKK